MNWSSYFPGIKNDRPIQNLLEVLETLVPLTRRANGEYHGACVFCGDGHDRFVVWPDQGRYWCRQCRRSGDAIQFLRDYEGLSYKGAVNRLGRRLAPRTPAIRRKEQRDRAVREQVRAEFAEWQHFMLDVLTTVYRTWHHSITAWESFLVTVRVTGEVHTLWQGALLRLYAKAECIEATLDLFTYAHHEVALLRIWDQWVSDSEDVQIRKLVGGEISMEDTNDGEECRF